MTTLFHVAPGVARLPITIANTYFIGEPGEPWVLVDTGTPGSAQKVLNAAAERYGESARPEAIVLTHGHIDHSGSGAALAEQWDVPVYAHPDEMPYLLGKSPYPPFDPTVGGFFSVAARFFPPRSVDLTGFVQELPSDGSVPGAPGWTWHPTPGHAPGHVSFFRDSDKTLLAGDALATVNMDSFIDMVTMTRQIARPATPVTCDWHAAKKSAEWIAGVKPQVLACGHGVPMAGPDLSDQLARFVSDFPTPSHGRYVPEPAITDAQHGIVSLPPAPFDPAPPIAGGVLATALAFAIVRRLRR